MASLSLPAHFFDKLTSSSARSKVQNFLDESTKTSLYSDLDSYFHPSNAALRKLESEGLWEIFEACSTETTSNQPCWNEESFCKFLGIKHPEIAISKDLVHLLWKIFQYYAYHPFAPKSAEETIDANGFRRAIRLLPLRCTELLGTLEHDYHWTMDNDRIMNGNVERIFRIMGQPQITTSLEDVMDVLASIQPTVSYCELPSPKQVESTARRLIGEEPTKLPFRVPRKGITCLMALLLRLKATKANFGAFAYQGSFDEEDSAYIEMTEILVNKMIGKAAYMRSDQIHQALASLPNFYGRFQLLWAVLFQSPSVSEAQRSSKFSELVPNYILGAFCLMLLPSDFSWRSQYDVGPYAWETTAEHLANSSDVNDAQFIECIVQTKCPRLILITTNGTSNSPRVIWGMYLVGPLWVDSNPGERCWDLKTNTKHYIFQLTPEFHWIKGLDSETPLTIVESDQSTASVEFEQKLWTWKSSMEGEGNPPSRKAVGIRAIFDLSAKSIMLTKESCDPQNKQRQATSPSEIFVNGQDIYSKGAGREILTGVDSIQVLGVPDGGDLQDGFLKRNDSRYFLNPQVPTISSEEIKSRIQGFGST